jgi:thioredoxin reductase
MYKLAIVGLGPAGIFTLAHVPPEILKNTIVFEPSAVGGALATEYSAVVANITKSVILNALRSVPRWSTAECRHLAKYADSECPLLGDVVKQLRELIAPELREVVYMNVRVINWQRQDSIWKLTTSSNQLFETQKLVVATGAVPKTLNLPKPAIPLHIALTPSLLANYVTAEDSVVVFGTAHSGTLALRNLRNAGVTHLTGIYKGEKPFYYARDGFSEGIKQESASIADDLTSNNWAKILRLDDFEATFRATSEATAVVYATGFNRSATKTNPEENIWAFGIGSPSTYIGPDGKSYPDVAFGGFISAIQEAVPLMLKFDS